MLQQKFLFATTKIQDLTQPNKKIWGKKKDCPNEIAVGDLRGIEVLSNTAIHWVIPNFPLTVEMHGPKFKFGSKKGYWSISQSA